MTFAEYYRRQFREDLAHVLRSAPGPNHLADDAYVPVMQPRVISRHNQTVRLWPPERRALFGVALFFTVLCDQVCYTHFSGSYRRFQQLTRYPKFKGDCPGGCYHHLHPEVVLASLGRPSSPVDWQVPAEVWPRLAEAAPVMEQEVLDFCRVHLLDLDGAAFWARCLTEIPRARTEPDAPAV